MSLLNAAGSADECQCCATGSKCAGERHALLKCTSAVLVLGAGRMPRPSCAWDRLSPCLHMLQWVLKNRPNTAAGKSTSMRRFVVSGALDALAAALQVGQLRHGCSVDVQACTCPAAGGDQILRLD